MQDHIPAQQINPKVVTAANAIENGGSTERVELARYAATKKAISNRTPREPRKIAP
jgi:hypothetical protein